MSKIFKPRRGKASTMNGTKSSTVLAAGEMFIELPDTGVGTGICKMKMGDGVTAYSSLPYAMGGDIASTEITGSIVEDTSETAKAALQNVTTGRTLGAIIGSLRQACKLNEAAISKLNDENSATKIINKILKNDTKSGNSGGEGYISSGYSTAQRVIVAAGDQDGAGSLIVVPFLASRYTWYFQIFSNGRGFAPVVNRNVTVIYWYL